MQSSHQCKATALSSQPGFHLIYDLFNTNVPILKIVYRLTIMGTIDNCPAIDLYYEGGGLVKELIA